MIIFDPERNFFGVLKNLVDFWNENVCLHLNRPKKVIWNRALSLQKSTKFFKTPKKVCSVSKIIIFEKWPQVYEFDVEK